MSGQPTYVLDADVFIQAARGYYAFDLVPGFWTNLSRFASQGRIRSVDRVKQELEQGKDDLASWIKENFGYAFDSKDKEEVVLQFAQLMRWVHAQSQFFDYAKAEFADGADGWLIAYARVNGCTVVTMEAARPDVRRRIPIPNVCQEFDVPFVNTYEMLRVLGVRFT